MSAIATVASYFNGPPTSGNGGYSCGLLGTLIGDSAEVTLRKPPPLDRAMTIEVDGLAEQKQWRLLDGDLLIAAGRVAEPDLLIPEPPSFERARVAESAYVGFKEHQFPSCFVCGPERAEGDGLRLFTGKLADREIVASAWTPAARFGTDDSSVDRKVVWSALDCPSYFAGHMKGYGRSAVLGRLTATLRLPIRVGAPYIVIGWPIGKDGRKWEGGTAIFTAEGELCAFARGLWIELKQ